MTAVVLFVLGLALLVIAGDRLVASATQLASRLGLSAMAAGAVIVGLGTSMPELITSVDANLQGYPGAAIGNVVGSNIANLLLVLGVSVLWLPHAVSTDVTRHDGLWLLAITVAGVGVLQWDVIGYGAGAALVLALGMYIYLSLARSRATARLLAEQQQVPAPSCEDNAQGHGAQGYGVLSVWLIAGVAGLAAGAHLLVTGAVGVASIIGISESLTGVLLLALGTSLPELTVTVIAIIQRNGSLALGNVVGSTVFNTLGILGVSALVKPMPVPLEMAQIHGWVMAAAVLAVYLFMRTGQRMSRTEGGMLLCGYLVYLTLVLI